MVKIIDHEKEPTQKRRIRSGKTPLIKEPNKSELILHRLKAETEDKALIMIDGLIQNTRNLNDLIILIDSMEAAVIDNATNNDIEIAWDRILAVVKAIR